jgi:prepilin-type N-terminal cleavage/methylation domain-containing protein
MEGHIEDIKGKEAGFGLIELIIVTLIVAVLTGIAVPSVQRILAQNKRASAVNELVWILKSARSEAIKSGYRVIICASADQKKCSGNWHDGWMLFIDHDRTAKPASPAAIRHVRGPFPKEVSTSSLSDLEVVGCKPTAAAHFSPYFCLIAGLLGCKSGKNCARWGRFSLSTIQVRQAASGNGKIKNNIAYQPNGHLGAVSGLLQNGIFDISVTGIESSQIIISNSGRPRVVNGPI